MVRLISLLLLLSHLAFAEDFGLDPNDFAFVDALAPLAEPSLQDFLQGTMEGSPKSCPSKTSDKDELLKKLDAVKNGLINGPCRIGQQDLVSNLNNIIANLATNMNAGSDLYGTSKVAAFTPPAAITNPNNVIASLGNLAGNPNCFNDIKMKGLLPTIADLAIAIGLLSMIVPTLDNYVTGVTAVTFGASLKVIQGLMLGVFDWRRPSDRQQFLELTCSYFQLRQELYASGFYAFKNEEVEIKLTEGERIFSHLNQYVQEVREKIQLAQNIIISKEEAYVELNDRKGSVFGLKNIDSLLQAIQGKIDTNAQKVASIDQIAKQSAMIIAYLQSEDDSYHIKRLVELLHDYDDTNIHTLYDKPIRSFVNKNQAPLLSQLAQVSAAITKRQELSHRAFYSLNSKNPGITNRKIAEDFFARRDFILSQLDQGLLRLTRRLAVLRALKQKPDINDYAQGAAMKYDLATEDRTLQQLIFGPRGWSFFHYLLGDILEGVKGFRRGFRRWEEAALRYKKQPNVEQKELLCLDARELGRRWELTKLAENTAVNFLLTNKDLFHSRVPHLRYFAYFIPIGTSEQLYLYANLIAFSRLNSYLKKDGLVSPEEERLIAKPLQDPRKNIGLLGVMLGRQLINRNILEEFVKAEVCFDTSLVR